MPRSLNSSLVAYGAGSGTLTLDVAALVVFFYSDTAVGGTTSGHDYYSTFAVDGTTIITLHKRTATTASGSDQVTTCDFAVESLSSGSHTLTATPLGSANWAAIIVGQ